MEDRGIVNEKARQMEKDLRRNMYHNTQMAWNYFKLLLETVERYVLVGVLCHTSPLAYSMGASKATSRIFQTWCRMVGSQLLLLKIAQKCGSYLAAPLAVWPPVMATH